jgi:hypothetical protein
MTLPAQCREYPDRSAGETTVRDVLGDPKAWPFCISDDPDGMPDLRRATILDVFITHQRLFLYLRGSTGTQAVAVFFIEDQDLRERAAQALQCGGQVEAALKTRICHG